MTKNRNSDFENDFWRVSMGAGGRVVIPAAVRDALGFAEGEPLVLTVDDGTVRIETYARSVERLRAQVRAMIRPTGDLVDRFLADKRAEAAREDSWVQADTPVDRAAE
ncbi:MAG: AbrB/MazE/SpoVT family DNA-binding domain-containing protein [Rhodospirillaceae bacterium]|nr:AbrB/MazE/SpoVT family DNA-binding domain-containing protein [Rhodospirillaceae bacterium]